MNDDAKSPARKSCNQPCRNDMLPQKAMNDKIPLARQKQPYKSNTTYTATVYIFILWKQFTQTIYLYRYAPQRWRQWPIVAVLHIHSLKIHSVCSLLETDPNTSVPISQTKTTSSKSLVHPSQYAHSSEQLISAIYANSLLHKRRQANAELAFPAIEQFQ